MKNQHTAAVTKRFITAMNEIITTNRLKGGKIVHVKAFAESVGLSHQNFSKYVNGQHVSASLIEVICRKYKVNPTYLVLGQGEIFLEKKETLEKRVEKLERMIKGM